MPVKITLPYIKKLERFVCLEQHQRGKMGSALVIFVLQSLRYEIALKAQGNHEPTHFSYVGRMSYHYLLEFYTA